MFAYACATEQEEEDRRRREEIARIRLRQRQLNEEKYNSFVIAFWSDRELWTGMEEYHCLNEYDSPNEFTTFEFTNDFYVRWGFQKQISVCEREKGPRVSPLLRLLTGYGQSSQTHMRLPRPTEALQLRLKSCPENEPGCSDAIWHLLFASFRL